MKKEEKNRLFSKKNMVSAFIIFIMVSSVIGFMWGRSGSVQKEEYKGMVFVLKENQWVIEINDMNFEFDFFPTETENINVSPSIASKMKNTLEIDSTYNLNDSQAKAIVLSQYRMSQILARLNIYLRMGLADENDFNLPIIDCDDATDLVPVLYFESSNQTKISLKGNCIIAESRNADDFIRIKDRLLYAILGVIS